MPDSLLREVRAHLQRYLLGTESLAEFHNWFVVAASDLRSVGGADDMVKRIELRLAEYKRGDWSESQLRGRLLDVLPAQTLAASEAESRPWTASGRGAFRVEPSGTQ
jgi:hypothetical protein